MVCTTNTPVHYQDRAALENKPDCRTEKECYHCDSLIDFLTTNKILGFFSTQLQHPQMRHSSTIFGHLGLGSDDALSLLHVFGLTALRFGWCLALMSRLARFYVWNMGNIC